jgi:RNA polymerase sigma-70 factor, ECF subfamily
MSPASVPQVASPTRATPGDAARQNERYEAFSQTLSEAVERLARGYEANDARRQDLVQDIHVAVWRSLATFDARCSLRTWVFRVAHNVAATHVLRERKGSSSFVGLEELEQVPAAEAEFVVETRNTLERLMTLVRSLTPTDRQVMLLYLEGENGAAIAEVSGLSASNVATKIHRLKKVLASQFHGGSHA